MRLKVVWMTLREDYGFFCWLLIKQMISIVWYKISFIISLCFCDSSAYCGFIPFIHVMILETMLMMVFDSDLYCTRCRVWVSSLLMRLGVWGSSTSKISFSNWLLF